MPIHFGIVRDGRNFSASVDGGTPFYIGRTTGFDGMEGLFNVPCSELPRLVYDAANFPELGFWAEFVAPTAKCESGNFLTLNT